MNEKLSFQNIVETLMQNAGVSKKIAETFAKAFFDTIVEALYMGESTIKVKGLGVFKLVEVDSRESVNVTNGERILIPGYKKVSFVPDDVIVEMLNREETLPVVSLDNREEEAEPDNSAVEALVDEDAPAEPVVEDMPVEPVTEEDSVAEPAKEEEVQEEVEAEKEEPASADDIEELIHVDTPQLVETVEDELSAIDFIISTPESIDEIRSQYEQAKRQVEEAVSEARKANAEKVRLEKLLQRLEANSVPENMETPADDEIFETSSDNTEDLVENVDNHNETELEIMPSEDDVDAHEDVTAETESSELATAVPPVVPPVVPLVAETDDDEEKWFNNWRAWIGIILGTVVLVGCIVFFLYKTRASINAVEVVPAEVVEQEEPMSVKKKESKPDSVSVKPVAEEKQKTDVANSKDTPASPQKPVAEKRTTPEFHIMKRGESLTRISVRYYGTKDSVLAIIRLNRFSNPDNVPVGAKVFLP